MAKGLNMKALLSLQTQGFKKGVAEAKKELASLKGSFMQFASTLGAAVGFTAFISSVKDVTTALNEAKDTMNAVSSNTYDYSDSLSFAKRVAKDYRKDITETINEYARFKTAAETAGISVENQKKIYESLIRSMQGYNLTSGKQAQVMEVINSSLAKQTIKGEQLEQIFKAFPQMYTALANAVGVSTSELRSFSEKNQILASEILPDVAKALDEVTGEVSFTKVVDYFQDMKNAWTEFVEALNVDSKLSSIYQIAAAAIRFVTKNLKTITAMVATLTTIWIGQKLIKAIKAASLAFKAMSSGSWVNVIVTGLVLIISKLTEMGRKADSFRKKMASISETTDLNDKLVKSQEALEEARAFTSDKKNIERYNRAKNNQKLQEQMTSKLYDKDASFAQTLTAGINAGRETNDIVTGAELQLIEAFEAYEKAIPELEKTIEDTDKQLKELAGDSNNGGGDSYKPPKDEPESLETTIQKAFDDYAKNRQATSNLVSNGFASEKELEKLEDDFVKDIAKNIKSLDDIDLLNLPESVKQQIKEAWNNSKARIELEIKSAAEKKQKQNDEKWAKYKEPTSGKRDTTFDYKTSKLQQIQEEAELAQQRVDNLTEAIKGLSEGDFGDGSRVKEEISKLEIELSDAKKNASDLKTKAVFAEMEEDVKEAKKAVNDLTVSSITNLANSLQNLTSSFQSFIDTINDEDTSGWEKLLAVFQQILSVVETVSSAIEGFNALQKASAVLTNAQAASTNQLAAAQVEQSAIAVAGTNAEAASSAIATSAKAGEAVAGATASGAKLPFPYNLAAIAAGVASVVAALSMIGAFADGGIVGGNSTSGDKLTARVNSGEMILNKGQQATLFNAIKSGNLGSGDVRFVIRGSDLVGALRNYNSKIRG